MKLGEIRINEYVFQWEYIKVPLLFIMFIDDISDAVSEAETV